MERHHSSPHTTGPAVALTLSDTDGQGQAAGHALLSMPVASFVATGTALQAASGRIQLFPAGTFAARDGRPGNLRGVNATSWRLTAQDAEAVIAHWQRTATPLVVDYEHQTQLAAQNGRPAPAAGWITSLEWEEGRGLFAGVDWTDKARAHIRAGEYRYISPVFAFDRQSGAVLRLICAALTNHPALDGMDAASATFTPYEEPPMKQILAALGLPETADEAAALAALTTLRQERDSAKAQAEAAPDPQKFVAMTTFSAVQQEAAKLRDELTKLKNEAQAAALKDDIEAALKDGRLTAATKGWAESLAKTAPDALKAFLATQPPVQALTGTQTGGRTPAGDKPGTVSLTAEELHICERLGLTREEFIEARQATEEE